MRRINESKSAWNTFIAFSLIPLSGFAMDVFIPSLPEMATHFRASASAIQLTLSIFMISYGISQFLVGGFVDSYGRYFPALISMFVFSAASFVIAYTHNLHLMYWMRAIQGLTVAIIVVSKRAYFVDLFSGDRLKKYTSMFSVIWAIAPIVAPFLGGFFQTTWGWESNFIFLGYFGLVFFIIELFTGGESLKLPQSFRLRPIVSIYNGMLRTQDFSSGMIILGVTYAMILVYGMSSPFLIESRLHFSASVTGYCSLFSGVSVFIGGTVSRILIQKPFFKKLIIASSIQLIAVVIFIPVTLYTQNLFTLLLFVFLLHSPGGFIFNNLLSYCLIRFPQHAGKASGLVGGGFSVVTSVLSSILVNTISISNQSALGTAYGVLAILVFVLLVKTKWGHAARKNETVETSQRMVVLE
jgi:DHA1 family bicyclomycin/chloramphenicol resistance-like MFS transporter